jgi:hypothetical protein
MIRYSLILYLLLSISVMGFSSCNRRVEVKEITPGVVILKPKMDAGDSMIFSNLRSLPDVQITEMKHCSYQKPIAEPIDSIHYFRNFLLNLPFLSYLASASVVQTGNLYYQNFICYLTRMDTVHQNRWLWIVDSMGYENSLDTSFYRQIQLFVPVTRVYYS